MKKKEPLASNAETEDPEVKARRDFLKKTVKSATTVPAVALLLAATSKPTFGQSGGGCGCGGS